MNRPYSILTRQYWQAYWITLRPYLMFLSGISGLVGLAQTTALSPPLLSLFFLIFFFSYGLGQAVTDVFQIDTDTLSSPYRPLTQGIITKTQVLTISLMGLLLFGFIFYLANPWTLVCSLLGIVGLITYTYFKKRWWGGPFWNAGVVALLPLIGYLLATNHWAHSSTLILSMLSIFFSYAIFVLLGYFKDISADRVTGYNTFPVVFGWKPGVFMSGLFLIATIVCSLFSIKNTDPYLASNVLWIAGAFCLAWAHVKMWDTDQDSKAFHAIEWVVRGYLLLHASEVAAFNHALTGFVLIYYIAFEILLKIRPERTQI